MDSCKERMLFAVQQEVTRLSGITHSPQVIQDRSLEEAGRPFKEDRLVTISISYDVSISIQNHLDIYIIFDFESPLSEPLEWGSLGALILYMRQEKIQKCKCASPMASWVNVFS